MDRVRAGLMLPFAALAALAMLAMPSACGSSGGAPAASSPVLVLSADAGDEAGLSAIASQCAAWPAHPLTAGSYTDPKTGLTVHWPSGWKLQTVGTNATFETLVTPVTWVPTGSTTAVEDEATFTLSVVSYGNAGQVQQAVQDPKREALTLAGHPGALWWWLAPPPQPQCPGGCLSVPSSPEILTIAGLVQFTTLDAGGGFGVEVDLTGSARANAQPAQVFCDIQAMILGVTAAASTDADAQAADTDAGSPIAWDGRTPLQHRASGATCPEGRDAGSVFSCDAAPPLPNNPCAVDSDCTAGKNGECLCAPYSVSPPSGSGPLTMYSQASCSYDACFVDSSCGPRVPCDCRDPNIYGSPNVCLNASNCAVDSDCGPPGFCSPSSVVGVPSLAYFCHTPHDECIDNSDCTPPGATVIGDCGFDMTRAIWVCDVFPARP